MDIQYKEQGGYLYPQLTTAPSDPLTYYGTMFKEYLKETQPGRYAVLLFNQKLMKFCHRMEDEANRYEGVILEKLRQSSPPPETDDTMKLIQYNNNLYQQAREITLNDVIYRKA
ncbi:TnpV protein [Caproicibacter fermentans]|uniref:TnpV protein n=1 Tax=Caproicibacter fermentans TaxID=2576756 RepID=A0A7G8TD60_9FIRM|nr:TnpV protein [Caproicibacter fermentans]QNK41551.1 TnpV protein [Caproicibacter fermentans]